MNSYLVNYNESSIDSLLLILESMEEDINVNELCYFTLVDWPWWIQREACIVSAVLLFY